MSLLPFVVPTPYVTYSVVRTSFPRPIQPFDIGHLRARREVGASPVGPVPPQRQPVLSGQGRPLPAAVLAPQGVSGRLPPTAHPFGLSGNLRVIYVMYVI